MSDAPQNVNIKITPSSIGTRVYVNGEEFEGVRSVDIRAAVDEPSRVTLTLVGAGVEVSGEIGALDVTALNDCARYWRARRGWFQRIVEALHIRKPATGA